MKFMVSYEVWHPEYSTPVSANRCFDELHDAVLHCLAKGGAWASESFAIYAYYPHWSGISAMSEIFHNGRR